MSENMFLYLVILFPFVGGEITIFRDSAKLNLLNKIDTLEVRALFRSLANEVLGSRLENRFKIMISLSETEVQGATSSPLGTTSTVYP